METSGNVTLRMIMPGREIGVIIGKGGETIGQIRNESEAKIFISDGSVPERVITVTGNGDAVCMAYNLICTKLEAGEEGKQNRKDILNLRLVVAAAQCGSIIGKAGSKIKEIRETCGANVNVGSDLLPGSSERCITVSASKDKAVEAIYQIVSILAAKPFSGSVVQYKPGMTGHMPPFGNPGPMPGRDDRRGGGRDGGMGGRMDGGMGGGLMGPPGGGALAALASMASSQIRRGDRNGGGGEMTHEMTVSNEHIGSIIGKGGSKIAEIRQMSGSMIQISKGTDKEQKNLEERTITITGCAESVTLAKNLINMSLELHQLERTDEGMEDDRDHGDHRGHDRRGGGGYDRRGDYGGGYGAGPMANREVVQALNTLAHFNNMTNGSLFGGGGYNQMGRGGRQQNGGGRGRDDRSGPVRNKFSPY